jgi:hypothetical protein
MGGASDAGLGSRALALDAALSKAVFTRYGNTHGPGRR